MVDSLKGKLHKKYSERLMLFYNVIMNMGGLVIAVNLAEHFKGPIYSTLMRHRKKFRKDIEIGVSLSKSSKMIRIAFEAYL